jgi:hypothetical protein
MPPNPSAQRPAPTKSTRRSATRVGRGSATRISTSVTRTSGTFSAKIQRHETSSTITPPTSGPTIEAIPPQAVQEPIAAARFVGSNAATTIASELGVTSAPAAPWSMRAPISTSIVGASAQPTDSSPKATTPTANTRRAP